MPEGRKRRYLLLAGQDHASEAGSPVIAIAPAVLPDCMLVAQLVNFVARRQSILSGEEETK